MDPTLAHLPVERETHHLGAGTREWVVDGHRLPSLHSRQISFLGVSEAAQGFEFATRGWRFGQIMVCHGGRGEVRVNGRWVECVPGDAYLTPALVPHHYRAIPDEPWCVIWITFDAPHDTTPLLDVRTAVLTKVDPKPLYHAVMSLFYAQLPGQDPALVASLSDAIEQLAYRCTPAHTGAGRLWPVWQAVDADLARAWSVDDLGELIGVSDEHLRRLCVRHLGRSPMAQVTLMRMRRAASLLRSRPLKVEAIAELVGYADRFGFASAFRRVYGASPARYRQSFSSAGTTGESTADENP
jgi:AraC-like DNA-binding protein